MAVEILSASILVIIGYSAYYYFTQTAWIRSYFAENFNHVKAAILMPLFRRIAGFLFFGFIPLIFILFSEEKFLSHYGISFSFSKTTVLTTLLFSALMVPIGVLGGKNLTGQKSKPQIPQMRIFIWNPGLLFLSTASWIVYLTAYEFLLRGFFFFACWRAWGLLPAFALNSAVYAVFHLHKNRREMAGSFFLGVVLCAGVYFTGTIWPALGAHAALALSMEWSAIYFNPRITFKLRSALQ